MLFADSRVIDHEDGQLLPAFAGEEDFPEISAMVGENQRG